MGDSSVKSHKKNHRIHLERIYSFFLFDKNPIIKRTVCYHRFNSTKLNMIQMGSRLADRKKLFLHPAGTQVKDPQNIGLS